MMGDYDWIKYDGDYEKEWYDIKLVNGQIIEKCWPNAGNFHAPDGKQYKSIEYIRLCPHPLDGDFKKWANVALNG